MALQNLDGELPYICRCREKDHNILLKSFSHDRRQVASSQNSMTVNWEDTVDGEKQVRKPEKNIMPWARLIKTSGVG